MRSGLRRGSTRVWACCSPAFRHSKAAFVAVFVKCNAQPKHLISAIETDLVRFVKLGLRCV